MGLEPVLSLRYTIAEFLPSLTALWCQSFKQFKIHLSICSSSSYFFSFSRRSSASLWGSFGITVNSLLTVKADSGLELKRKHWFPLIYQAWHFLLENYQLLKPDFLLVNPCWLYLGTFCLYTCLEMVPQSSWSITFLRTDLRSEQPLPSPPFWPSWAQDCNLKTPFPVPSTMIIENLLGVAYQQYQLAPSALMPTAGLYNLHNYFLTQLSSTVGMSSSLKTFHLISGACSVVNTEVKKA